MESWFLLKIVNTSCLPVQLDKKGHSSAIGFPFSGPHLSICRICYSNECTGRVTVYPCIRWVCTLSHCHSPILSLSLTFTVFMCISPRAFRVCVTAYGRLCACFDSPHRNSGQQSPDRWRARQPGLYSQLITKQAKPGGLHWHSSHGSAVGRYSPSA